MKKGVEEHEIVHSPEMKKGAQDVHSPAMKKVLRNMKLYTARQGVEEHELVHSPAMKKGVEEHEIGGRGRRQRAEAGGSRGRRRKYKVRVLGKVILIF